MHTLVQNAVLRVFGMRNSSVVSFFSYLPYIAPKIQDGRRILIKISKTVCIDAQISSKCCHDGLLGWEMQLLSRFFRISNL